MPSDDSIERLYVVNELMDLFLKHQDLLINNGVLKIVLFGSTAKGSATNRSDIDLCVVFKKFKDGEYGNFIKKQRNFINLFHETNISNYIFKFHPPSKDGNKYIHVTLDVEDDDIEEAFTTGGFEIWRNHLK